MLVGNLQNKEFEKLCREINKCYDDSYCIRTHLIQFFFKDEKYHLYGIHEYERTEFRLVKVINLDIKDDDLSFNGKIIYRGDDYRELVGILNKLHRGETVYLTRK